MERLTLILTFSLISLFVLGQMKVSGVYEDKNFMYGRFKETLTLNCDSTVTLNYKGDSLNDNSFGKWTTNDKILTLTLDSTLHPNQRYKGKFNYLIKKNRLILIDLTEEKYNEIKKKAKQNFKNNSKELLLSYEDFIKKYNKRIKSDINGKRVVIYFKKINSNVCE